MPVQKNTTDLTVVTWLAQKRWQAFDFQREAWAHIAAGRSGLLHASTGSGKTYAIWLGVLQAMLDRLPTGKTAPLSVIWLTPMRALAADTARALREPMQDLAPNWTLGVRTGDTPSSERSKQDRRMPTVLITTPESLTLLTAREKCAEELSSVRFVIADEWHELLGNKRGVQTQLALARLRAFNPNLVTWGLSATLSNIEQSAQILCRVSANNALKIEKNDSNAPMIVRGKQDKDLRIDTLIPEQPGNYSWAGHLGARMLKPVVNELAHSGTTLVFTNTRSQAEIWYQLILAERPDWAGQIALHHGSLDKEVRDWVEQSLKAGQLKAVVATSSLDLGVDFLPVERVLQIGSAKGVARLIQRAGRSGHAPGRTSRITLVPTNTLELIEAAAARRAAQAGQIEGRTSPHKPLDVLVQHIVTVALGGGFKSDELFDEVRTAFAYAKLTRLEFDWALGFCERGGDSLAAYPDYHRIKPDERGIYRVPDKATARRHRMSIGTIVSDASIQVKYLTGQRIGTIEESFIARLKKGEGFTFAGRVLELIRVQDMTAYVKRAEKNKAAVPSWQGGKMPLSSELAENVVALLCDASEGDVTEPEMQAALPMLATQMRLSRLPTNKTLLIEQFTSKEGHHLYIYPFAGRNVHLGLASLVAYRLALDEPATFSLSVNDYGFELLSATAFDVSRLQDQSLFSSKDLLADVLASLNSSELAQRRFREIARISGLIFTGFPGAAKSNKQVQASSGLFFEVFKKYDEQNLLLVQAQQEVLSQELDIAQLQASLQTMQSRRLEWVHLSHPSPFCLPLMVERLREKLSNEKLADRLDRILREAERI
jgi:ATP-dependent helicase Lhr and Lhr-like helicase